MPWFYALSRGQVELVYVPEQRVVALNAQGYMDLPEGVLEPVGPQETYEHREEVARLAQKLIREQERQSDGKHAGDAPPPLDGAAGDRSPPWPSNLTPGEREARARLVHERDLPVPLIPDSTVSGESGGDAG